MGTLAFAHSLDALATTPNELITLQNTIASSLAVILGLEQNVRMVSSGVAPIFTHDGSSFEYDFTVTPAIVPTGPNGDLYVTVNVASAVLVLIF